jgi:hypothetical protein
MQSNKFVAHFQLPDADVYTGEFPFQWVQLGRILKPPEKGRITFPLCIAMCYSRDIKHTTHTEKASVASVARLTFGPGDFRLLCNHWGCKEGPSVPLGESAQEAQTISGSTRICQDAIWIHD